MASLVRTTTRRRCLRCQSPARYRIQRQIWRRGQSRLTGWYCARHGAARCDEVGLAERRHRARCIFADGVDLSPLLTRLAIRKWARRG